MKILRLMTNSLITLTMTMSATSARCETGVKEILIQTEGAGSTLKLNLDKGTGKIAYSECDLNKGCKTLFNVPLQDFEMALAVYMRNSTFHSVTIPSKELGAFMLSNKGSFALNQGFLVLIGAVVGGAASLHWKATGLAMLGAKVGAALIPAALALQICVESHYIRQCTRDLKELPHIVRSTNSDPTTLTVQDLEYTREIFKVIASILAENRN